MHGIWFYTQFLATAGSVEVYHLVYREITGIRPSPKVLCGLGQRLHRVTVVLGN